MQETTTERCFLNQEWCGTQLSRVLCCARDYILVTVHRHLVVVSARKEVSVNTCESQEQQKNAKDTHYYYIDHALIVY